MTALDSTLNHLRRTHHLELRRSSLGPEWDRYEAAVNSPHSAMPSGDPCPAPEMGSVDFCRCSRRGRIERALKEIRGW